jgi:hypothetical protein
MAELLCEEFSFTTRYLFYLVVVYVCRQQIGEILENTRRYLDVEVLVGVLKKTIAFEKELAERFGPMIIEEQEVDENNHQNEKEELSQVIILVGYQ